MSNCFADFLQKAGLYESITISKSNIGELCDLIGGTIKISEYCVKCKEERVFAMKPLSYVRELGGGKKQMKSLAEELTSHQKIQQMDRTPHPGEVADRNDWYWTNWQTEEATRIMVFHFACAMDDTHHIDFVVHTSGNTMTKIGQFPSVADLAFPELKQFEKVIDTQSRKEMGTALGLFAHGVGAGSYVYLRRIFEKILDMAKHQAEKDKTLDLTGYDTMHVSDRIVLLKDYLPEMINSNPAIYGIVSKGIHELSEEECIKYFPVMRDSIYVVLRQWEEKRKERESIRQLESSISAIASEIK